MFDRDNGGLVYISVYWGAFFSRIRLGSVTLYQSSLVPLVAFFGVVSTSWFIPGVKFALLHWSRVTTHVAGGWEEGPKRNGSWSSSLFDFQFAVTTLDVNFQFPTFLALFPVVSGFSIFQLFLDLFSMDSRQFLGYLLFLSCLCFNRLMRRHPTEIFIGTKF